MRTGTPLVKSLCASAFAVLFVAAEAGADSRPHDALRLALDDYLRAHTAGLPGEVRYTIGRLDPRLQLRPCAALQVFSPPGSRLWGNTQLGVRCTSPEPWTVYVPVTVRVSGSYVATARPLPGGHVLAESDLVVQTGDLTLLPPGVLTDPRQGAGKTLAAPLAGGQPLRPDLLRAPVAIQQGQTVRLVSRGTGFQVSAEGRALNQAAAGQVVQVRGPSGTTVSGIARPGGVVEIGY